MTDRLRRYHDAARVRSYSHPEERMGQRAFNALHEVEPEVADAIRGTDDDPFYDDSRLPEFMGVVCARLR